MGHIPIIIDGIVTYPEHESGGGGGRLTQGTMEDLVENTPEQFVLVATNPAVMKEVIKALAKVYKE